MKYLLSFGSNIGDKRDAIERALCALEMSGVRILSLSSFYRTAPIDAPPQDDFVNAAAVVEGPDDPEELLGIIARIEASLGRTRGMPNAPRTIDIDIVLAEIGNYRSTGLEIPHPRWRGRRFVIDPAREAAMVFEPFAREVSSIKEADLQEQRVEKMEECP